MRRANDDKSDHGNVRLGGDDSPRIRFDAPVRAATPGQPDVFYDEENRIIGGGIITN